MHDHARVEVRVWIGFAASFSLAFLATILAQDRLTADQVWATWTVALSAGFLLHGIWHHDRIGLLTSALSQNAVLLRCAVAVVCSTCHQLRR